MRLKGLPITFALALVALVPSIASAASYVVGATIVAKVTHSSTGAPCESSCWEAWQISGIGAFMVVKDVNGYITKVGQRRYDPELDELFMGTDEAIRTLPKSPAVYRYGYVTTTTNGTACTANCAFGAFFGVPVVFILNAQSVADVVVDEPALTLQPLGNTTSNCQDAAHPVDCHTRTLQGSPAGAPIVVITIYYDKNGDVVEITEEVNGVKHTIFKK